jgi:hypothetical protein
MELLILNKVFGNFLQRSKSWTITKSKNTKMLIRYFCKAEEEIKIDKKSIRVWKMETVKLDKPNVREDKMKEPAFK